MSGFIPEEDINEIRERNDLVAVASEYLTLKRTGRNFKASCPFHKEKTPSFVVDPEKQLYHCFGCGEGGSVYNFVMKMENLDFPEAVETLAERINYSIRYKKTKGLGSTDASKKTRFFEANKFAMKFYHELLVESHLAKGARDYLGRRGYSQDILNLFTLGFSPPEWRRLTDYLRKRGYPFQELEVVGLSIRGEKGTYYDRFRSRIIFPIFDIKDRVVGFGARILEEKDKDLSKSPKYLNSPETPIFRKRSTLYALSLAKSEIVKKNEALIVEGYTDVLSLFKSGIRNVVATLGTALTKDHLGLLTRFTKRIILVFDADVAGTKAVERGLELLSDTKADLKVVSLPGRTDPADFVERRGKESFEKLVRAAIPLTDFCLDQVLAKFNLKESEARVRAANESFPIFLALNNALAEEQYLEKLAQKLGVSEDSLKVEYDKYKRSSSPRSKVQGPRSKSAPKARDFVSSWNGKSPQEIAEREMLKLLLQKPSILPEALKKLREEFFSNQNHQDLFSFLKKESFSTKSKPEKGKPSIADILSRVSNEDLRRLISDLSLDSLHVEDEEKYFEDILQKLKEFDLQCQINILKRELEKLNPVTSGKKYDLLFEDLLKLEAKKRDLKKKVTW